MIEFQCSCGRPFRVSKEQAGLPVICPTCYAPLQAAEAPARGEPPPQGRPKPELSNAARASLIAGICTFFIPVLMAIPAILLGIRARREIRRSNGSLIGGGLAIIGIACGIVGNLGLLGYDLFLKTLLENRASASIRKDLYALGLVMETHHDHAKRFPAAAVTSRDGEPLLSWRVSIWSYFDPTSSLWYKHFMWHEPWDSPYNALWLPWMPPEYGPTRGNTPQPYSTCYQVFRGPNTLFPTPEHKPRLWDIRDGTSNTFLIVEAAEAVPWTKPADVEIRPDRPLPRLGGQVSGGFHATFADGSVRWLRSDLPESLLRRLIDPKDGQILPPDWDR